MFLSRTLSQPVPEDYPSSLAQSGPHRPAVAPRPALLAGLVLLCLIPRAWVAVQHGGICPDGVLYIDLARALEAGDLQAGLREMQLNTFPVILMVLHRLGLDWLVAGMAWNVVVASLVVLPMYGWARRQFDDRVAWVACVLYAVHPGLIVWSCELIRDPTFWLLFMLSLYLLWRAVTEVRIVLFVAAGLAMTLSWLTRFEGLFLFIPLVLWTFWRWRALSTARGRLIAGAVLCVGAVPALLVAANVLFFHDAQHFALSRLRPLSLVDAFFRSLAGSKVSSAAGIVREAGAPAGLPLFGMLRVFFPTMTRGLSPAFALLMFGGLWGWRRVWLRRDHQALFYTALAVLAGIWINLWYVQVSCPRYAFSIVLMASVFAALGVLGLTARCVRWLEGRGLGLGVQSAAALGPLAAVALLGAAGVLASDYSLRRTEVQIGRWIRQEYGPSARVAGPVGMATSIGFYAQAQSTTFPHDPGDETIASVVRESRPDVLLLYLARRMKPDRYAEVIGQMKQLGLETLARDRLPDVTQRLHVLARPQAGPRLAGAPGALRAKDY